MMNPIISDDGEKAYLWFGSKWYKYARKWRGNGWKRKAHWIILYHL